MREQKKKKKKKRKKKRWFEAAGLLSDIIHRLGFFKRPAQMDSLSKAA
jgi:hypothetical protein